MPDGSLSTTQPFWLTYRAPFDPSATPVVANPIPLAETMDPGSPDFMHFAVPAALPAACRSWMTPGTSSSTTRAPR